MGIKAFISGCAGLELSSEEVSFFQEHKPWGLILFARNCASPDQIKNLISQFKDACGNSHAPILIDQEGGRVQRLTPPIWTQYCSSNSFGRLYETDPEKAKQATWLQSRLIAHDLNRLGMTINCLPVLDVPQKSADDIIGDRAYGLTPEIVSQLGAQAISGLLAGGVLPVMKHIPGHGRALCDSHLDLPIVDTGLDELSAIDFAPFKSLSDTPLAMTAHIVYSKIDDKEPATHSRIVIQDIIRTQIGFDGVLMSDDLSMEALSGSISERTEKCLQAGCDLALHCNGNLDEMHQVASHSPELAGEPLKRCEKALALLCLPETFDEMGARYELNQLLSPQNMS